jgi:hypothetical protein
MRNSCLVEFTQPSDQILEESIELSHTPVPVILSAILDDLSQVGINPLHDEDMTIGVINAFDSGLNHIVLVHIQQKLRVEFTNSGAEIHLAQYVCIIMAVFAGKRANEEGLLLRSCHSLEHPSRIYLLIVDHIFNHDVLGLCVEGLLKLFVDRSLKRDVLAEGLSHRNYKGFIGPIAFAKEFPELSKRRDVLDCWKGLLRP